MQVAIKAHVSPNDGQFLRAHPDGSVDLDDSIQLWQAHQNAVFESSWIVTNNFPLQDGTWSFKDMHGKWLSDCQDGKRVTTMRLLDNSETFCLLNW